MSTGLFAHTSAADLPRRAHRRAPGRHPTFIWDRGANAKPADRHNVEPIARASGGWCCLRTSNCSRPRDRAAGEHPIGLAQLAEHLLGRARRLLNLDRSYFVHHHGREASEKDRTDFRGDRAPSLVKSKGLVGANAPRPSRRKVGLLVYKRTVRCNNEATGLWDHSTPTTVVNRDTHS